MPSAFPNPGSPPVRVTIRRHIRIHSLFFLSFSLSNNHCSHTYLDGSQPHIYRQSRASPSHIILWYKNSTRFVILWVDKEGRGDWDGRKQCRWRCMNTKGMELKVPYRLQEKKRIINISSFIFVIVWLCWHIAYSMLSLQNESHRWAQVKRERGKEIGSWLVHSAILVKWFFSLITSLSLFCLQPHVALARTASAEDCTVPCLHATLVSEIWTQSWSSSFSPLFCFVLWDLNQKPELNDGSCSPTPISLRFTMVQWLNGTIPRKMMLKSKRFSEAPR
jgi:hypothetical protein